MNAITRNRSKATRMAGVSAVFCLAALACAVARADEAPLGHKDFYPSAARPLGFRGDGTGCFSGATPVTEWWEGALREEEKTVGEGKAARKVKVRVRVAGDSRNVVWKTKLPGWSDTQPLVIGDRVVGVAEPDWIFCLDANTGRMLWQDRVLPMLLGPPQTNDAPTHCGFAPEDAWKKQQVVDIARATAYLGRVRPGSPAEESLLCTRALVRLDELRQTLSRLDPAPEIMAGMDALIKAWEERAGGAVEHGLCPPHSLACQLLSPVMARYRIALAQVWPACVGLVQSTPVTDGERVYVAMGPGQVAAYDLLGNRVWGWREMEFQLKGSLYCDHTPSLIMADGVLLVRSHFGDLMGIDPKSGRILHNTDIGDSYNHGAFSTPGVMKLTSPGGKQLTVVITQHNKVIAAKDGRIVATLPPFKQNDVGHGQPRMVWKDLVLLHSSQGVPPDDGPAVIAKVTLNDAGEVATEQVHRFDGSSRFPNVPMALTGDGYLLGGHHTGKNEPGVAGLWRLSDGVRVKESTGPFSIRDGGVVIAGKYAFNTRYVENRTGDSWIQATFPGWALPEPGVSTELPGRRELGFDDPPPDVNFDTWLTNFPGVNYTVPVSFGLRNGGMVASGNRLFAQSWAHLYCIGDPKVAYDWNPQSRPAAISDVLARHTAAANASPAQRLAAATQWERDQAAAAIRALPPEKQAALAAEVAKVVAASEWPAFDAALAVVREMGPRAAGGADEFLRSAKKALAENRADRFAAIMQVCSVAAPGRQADLLPDVVAKFKAADGESLRTACIAAGALGPTAEASVPDLTKLLAHADARVGAAAARGLGGIGARAAPATDALAGHLSSDNPAMVVSALDALNAIGPDAKAAIGRVAVHLGSGHADIAVGAARFVKSVGPEAKPVFENLLKAMKHPSYTVVSAAVEAALAVDPTREAAICDALTNAAGDSNGDSAKNGLRALGQYGPGFKDKRAKTIAVNGLVAGIKSRSRAMKSIAVQAVGQFGAAAEAAVPALREEANGTECAEAAKAALQKIKPGGSETLMDASMDLGL